VAQRALGLVLGAPVTLAPRCGRRLLLVRLRCRLRRVICLLLRLVWRLVTHLLCLMCVPLRLGCLSCAGRHTATACTVKLTGC